MSILLSHLHCLDNQFLYSYNNEVYAESRGIVSCMKLNLSLRCNINYLGDYHLKQVVEDARRINTLTLPVVERLNGKITKFNGKGSASQYLPLLAYHPSENIVQLQREVQFLREANARKDLLSRVPIIVSIPSGTPASPSADEQLTQHTQYKIVTGDKWNFDTTTKILTIPEDSQQILKKSDYFKTLLSTQFNHTASLGEISNLIDNMLLYIGLSKTSPKEQLSYWKDTEKFSDPSQLDRALDNLLFALTTNEPHLSCFWEDLLCDTLPLTLENLNLISQLSDYLKTYDLQTLTKKIAHFLVANLHTDGVGQFLADANFVLPLHTLDGALICTPVGNNLKSLSLLFSKISVTKLVQSCNQDVDMIALLLKTNCAPLCQQITHIDFVGFTKRDLKPLLTADTLNHFPSLICLDLGSKVETTELAETLKKLGFTPSSFGTRFTKPTS